jgi:hypothetical protein
VFEASKESQQQKWEKTLEEQVKEQKRKYEKMLAAKSESEFSNEWTNITSKDKKDKIRQIPQYYAVSLVQTGLRLKAYKVLKELVCLPSFPGNAVPELVDSLLQKKDLVL